MFSFEQLPLAGIVFATTFYSWAIYTLKLKGRKWPASRYVPFYLGMLCGFIATQTWVAANDTKSFSVHVAQHLLLAMAAPPLIALGAPATLYLSASGRKLKKFILAILHSRYLKVVSHPLLTWFLFVGTLFVLYFSPLYELSLKNELFHDFLHLHFLLAGFLYFAPVVAIDPWPHKMHFGARLLYVGLSLPAHAFLALALLSATTPLAADWYMRINNTDLNTVLNDQKLGAAIMWIASDLIAISVVGIVANLWFRQDMKEAYRFDRDHPVELSTDNETQPVT